MCVHVILFKNAILFWCFTLLYFCICEQFSFLFTLKKSLSTERLLICPRDETGSLYITRWGEKGISNCCCRAHSFNTDRTHFLAQPLSMTASFSCKKLKIYEIQINDDHISVVGRSSSVCMNSFHRALQNSVEKSGNSFVSRIRIFQSFFHRERTLKNFMGRRVFIHLRWDFLIMSFNSQWNFFGHGKNGKFWPHLHKRHKVVFFKTF